MVFYIKTCKIVNFLQPYCIVFIYITVTVGPHPAAVRWYGHAAAGARGAESTARSRAHSARAAASTARRASRAAHLARSRRRTCRPRRPVPRRRARRAPRAALPASVPSFVNAHLSDLAHRGVRATMRGPRPVGSGIVDGTLTLVHCANRLRLARTTAERCLESASGHDAAAQPRHGDDAHIHQRKCGGSRAVPGAPAQPPIRGYLRFATRQPLGCFDANRRRNSDPKPP